MDPVRAARSGGSQQPPAILYEDAWLVAVDKPVGIIVHADGTGTQTLTDLVRAMLIARDGAGDAQAAAELQPLQRLDRETTGIVLFSKQKAAQPAFDALIASRQIEKRYLAIVHGRFPADPRTFDAAIGRDRHDARRMRESRTGKPARTSAQLIAHAPADAHGAERSLLAVDLLTGRKHQIRVHLGAAGFPIWGDALYGHPSARERAGGLMLHAAEMAFTHPVAGNPVRIQAPYPARFEPLFPKTSQKGTDTN